MNAFQLVQALLPTRRELDRELRDALNNGTHVSPEAARPCTAISR